jgi:hypothetical protein
MWWRRPGRPRGMREGPSRAHAKTWARWRTDLSVPADVFVDLFEPRDQQLDPGIVGEDGRGTGELAAEDAAEHRIEEQHGVRAKRTVRPAGLQEVDCGRGQAAELDLACNLLNELVALLVGRLEREAHEPPGRTDWAFTIASTSMSRMGPRRSSI